MWGTDGARVLTVDRLGWLRGRRPLECRVTDGTCARSATVSRPSSRRKGSGAAAARSRRTRPAACRSGWTTAASICPTTSSTRSATGASAPASALKEPETNGVVERWNRTLKEQAVYGRVFQNLAERARRRRRVRRALQPVLAPPLAYRTARPAKRRATPSRVAQTCVQETGCGTDRRSGAGNRWIPRIAGIARSDEGPIRGPSPPGRGIQPCDGRVVLGLRSIPARAGKPATVDSQATTVHPGAAENTVWCLLVSKGFGSYNPRRRAGASSPRVRGSPRPRPRSVRDCGRAPLPRGNLNQIAKWRALLRFIPARTGKPLTALPTTWSGNAPSYGGAALELFTARQRGPSPRGRGNEARSEMSGARVT